MGNMEEWPTLIPGPVLRPVGLNRGLLCQNVRLCSNIEHSSNWWTKEEPNLEAVRQ